MITTSLSLEQQYAFEKYKQGESLFITGPGGTGKTKLIQYIYSDSLATGIKEKLQICALTGCSSVLLNVNAKTIHSWSGIKLAKDSKEKVIQSVIKNRKMVTKWKMVKTLIIDEVSMLSRKLFEILDGIARIIFKNPGKPFGGLQVLFLGDFFQLPPISDNFDMETSQFCFESPVWYELFPPKNQIQLTVIYRQNDPAFIQILSEIRRGQLSDESNERLKQCVDRDMTELKEKGIIPTRLFAVRSKADYINNLRFNELIDAEYTFQCIKMTNCDKILSNGVAIPLEMLIKCQEMTLQEKECEINILLGGSLCNPVMSLKKGAYVMCTANLNLDIGICNGSCGTIIEILNRGALNIPLVKFNNGIIMEIGVHFIQSSEYPIIAVGNIPLILAWAMTIHKSQGASLEYAHMDLGNSIFEDGQTYVGLSRVKSLDGLYLSAFNPYRIKANSKVIAFYSKIPNLDLSNYVFKPNAISSPENHVEKSDFSKFAYDNPPSKIIVKKINS
jgi:ATP-dependent DNA helicase PIF1